MTDRSSDPTAHDLPTTAELEALEGPYGDPAIVADEHGRPTWREPEGGPAGESAFYGSGARATTAELGERTTRSALQRLADERSDTAANLTDRAMGAIAEAREELAIIEAELRDAALGSTEYRRIGRVDGLDVQAIFDAFAALENAAQLRELARRELEAERAPMR